jgi:hypothetical protein
METLKLLFDSNALQHQTRHKLLLAASLFLAGCLMTATSLFGLLHFSG